MKKENKMKNAIELIDLQQGSPEWHEFRLKGLGASDAPIYMGVSPWESPYGLWQQKLGLKKGPEENDAMRRGKEKEEIARKEFETQSGISVKPVVIKNREYPHLFTSMDGIDSSFTKAVEIKVPGKIDHESAMDGIIPEKYKWQLTQQLIVCDLDMIYYFSWNEDSSKIIEFSCGKTNRDNLLDESKKFWECVDNLKEPALTERDYALRTDKEFLQAEYDYLSAKKDRQDAEEREKRLREELIRLSGDQCCRGSEVRLTKYVTRGRIDYGSVPSLKEIDLEPYRKPNSVSWRIS